MNRAGNFTFKGRYTLRGINNYWFVYDRETGTIGECLGGTFKKAEQKLIQKYGVEV